MKIHNSLRAKLNKTNPFMSKPPQNHTSRVNAHKHFKGGGHKKVYSEFIA